MPQHATKIREFGVEPDYETFISFSKSYLNENFDKLASLRHIYNLLFGTNFVIFLGENLAGTCV